MARYSVNKAILVGNLGRDPELRYTADGKPVANFSLATSRSTKDAAGAWQQETEWHSIVAWERLAELASQSLHKGSKVYVEGRIRSRKYTDNQGIERTSFDIIANDLTLLDRRTDTSESSDDDHWESGSPDARDRDWRFAASGEPETAHLYQRPPPPAAKQVFTNDELDEIPF